ncbi:MAG: hypothetical protein CMP86_02155 [Gammaproteobacteria bacterium]|nr:hypothetical protein [Gammaproteobacteria bacterium]
MVPLFYLPQQDERARTLAPWCQAIEVDPSGLAQVLLSPRAEAALVLDELGLGLLMPGHQHPYRLPQQHIQRRSKAGHLTELSKACGVPQGQRRILDACAGFGTDGMTLAAQGCTVTMVERNTLIWLLLREHDQAFGRVTVEHGDCMDFMGDPQGWDVIYLDPMFPPRRKTALPNLGLQHLRELSAHNWSGDGDDLQRQIALARSCAAARVVVKRRLKDPKDVLSAFQIKGKSIRFDVYLPI